MLKKISYLVSLIILLILVGCEEEPVAPINNQTNKITGETHLVESANIGTVNKVKNRFAQISNQVTVFNDISSNEQLSGVRTVEVASNYLSNGEGHSAGSFSLDAKNGHWEGDWTGTTTLAGTTITAIGYNLDDRDQSCEWKYYFPSSLEGKRGTFSARIHSNRE